VEISRSQLWQWIQRGAHLNDGRAITAELFEQMLHEELSKIESDLGSDLFQQGRFAEASEILRKVVLSDSFIDFVTLIAYDSID
ncbi:MAG: malate synthase A, partial [Fimbriimonadales bacterium]